MLLFGPGLSNRRQSVSVTRILARGVEQSGYVASQSSGYVAIPPASC
jgi:hypothetical protein